MTDSHFALFLTKFGAATHRVAALETSLLRYENVLPPALLRIWREEGWCGYADGLFWTVDPSEYAELVEDWLVDTPYAELDDFHVIARSAFGDLYAWGRRNNRSLVVACPTSAVIADESRLRRPAEDAGRALGIFFAAKDRDACDMLDEQGSPLFERARRRLGQLAPNEVYGFEPALFAGGKRCVESLARLDLFAHLAVLRALTPPTAPFAGFDSGF